MNPQIKFTIITLFPEALQPYLDSSMLYKAQKRGIIEINYVNLRDFGMGPHQSVDDTPYGGGDGMILRCEPAFAAIESIKKNDPTAKVIMPTPVGEIWNQALAQKFAGVNKTLFAEQQLLEEKTNLPTDLHPAKAARMKAKLEKKRHQARVGVLEASIMPKGGETAVMPKNALEGDFEGSNEKTAEPEVGKSKHYIIFCPHYEGYDERIMTAVDYPISLGNYVLTGGELPALIIIDSITRLLPGVLGGKTSAEIESFSDGDNLEFPQYTKPADFRGMTVPEVLLSGDHGKVAEWRLAHMRRQEK